MLELQFDRDVILRQFDEPFLPLTNNPAERALRHRVISRHLSDGTRSPDGSRAMALLASVIETCCLRKASSWRFLTSVINAARTNCALPSLPIRQLLGAGV